MLSLNLAKGLDAHSGSHSVWRAYTWYTSTETNQMKIYRQHDSIPFLKITQKVNQHILATRYTVHAPDKKTGKMIQLFDFLKSIGLPSAMYPM